MSGTTLRIAVADDEPVMQMYLEETLTGLGHEVTVVAKDGRDLVDKWRLHPADLIITDIKMPVLDGLAAVREIYRESIVPVVFLTGYNSLDNIDHRPAEFVFVYLVKPVGEEDLRRAVDTGVRLRDEFQLFADDCGGARCALEMWGLVERAKEVIEERIVLQGRTPFEWLRRDADEHGRTLIDAAMRALDFQERAG